MPNDKHSTQTIQTKRIQRILDNLPKNNKKLVNSMQTSNQAPHPKQQSEHFTGAPRIFFRAKSFF